MEKNAIEINKKGWSWLGFLFAPHYYAGYGQLKKGLLLAVISGIMPLVAVAVGIYGGLKARQELPIKEVEFNWKNVAFTVITMIIVSLISQTVISKLKDSNGTENNTAMTANSSFFSGGGAMPLTQENVDDYMHRVDEATQKVDQSAELFEKMYEAFKKPLEDMGYDFEETLLNTEKASYNQQNVSDVNAVSNMGIMVNNILQGVYQDKSGAVSSKFISQETLDKLDLYENLHAIHDFKSLFNFLDMVIECENMGGGVCTGVNMIGLLQKNIPLNEEIRSNMGSDSSSIYMTYKEELLRGNSFNDIDSSGKYSAGLLKKPNGEKFLFTWFDENSQFHLDHALYEELKKDAQSAWWL